MALQYLMSVPSHVKHISVWKQLVTNLKELFQYVRITTRNDIVYFKVMCKFPMLKEEVYELFEVTESQGCRVMFPPSHDDWIVTHTHPSYKMKLEVHTHNFELFLANVT